MKKKSFITSDPEVFNEFMNFFCVRRNLRPQKRTMVSKKVDLYNKTIFFTGVSQSWCRLEDEIDKPGSFFFSRFSKGNNFW